MNLTRKLRLAAAMLFAVTLSCGAAQVKIVDLPLTSAVATNHLLEISDAGTNSQKANGIQFRRFIAAGVNGGGVVTVTSNSDGTVSIAGQSYLLTNNQSTAVTLPVSLDVGAIKLTGGQTASRALILNSGTNVTTATGTPDGTKFLRDDGVYAAVAAGGGGLTNNQTTPVTFETNFFVLGTGVFHQIKFIGGQTASRALILNSSTNVTTATGTPDGTKFLRDDNSYAAVPLPSFALTNNQTTAVTFQTNVSILGTGIVMNLKFIGGQTASRALILDSSTNVTTATGTPDGTKFLRDDGAYAAIAVPTGAITNNHTVDVVLNTNLTVNGSNIVRQLLVTSNSTFGGNIGFSGGAANRDIGVSGDYPDSILLQRSIVLKTNDANAGITISNNGNAIVVDGHIVATNATFAGQLSALGGQMILIANQATNSNLTLSNSTKIVYALPGGHSGSLISISDGGTKNVINYDKSIPRMTLGTTAGQLFFDSSDNGFGFNSSIGLTGVSGQRNLGYSSRYPDILYAQRSVIIKSNDTSAGITISNNGDSIRIEGNLISRAGFASSNLVVGAINGGVITNLLTASATLDFPSTSSGAIADMRIAVTGAESGDVVEVGVPQATATGLLGSFSGFASNASVFVRFVPVAATQDPASGTFKVVVTKF